MKLNFKIPQLASHPPNEDAFPLACLGCICNQAAPLRVPKRGRCDLKFDDGKLKKSAAEKAKGPQGQEAGELRSSSTPGIYPGMLSTYAYWVTSDQSPALQWAIFSTINWTESGSGNVKGQAKKRNTQSGLGCRTVEG